MATGIYGPTWESLRQYDEAPTWFMDAKFGMWAHWGPQCQPGYGDWYARYMYYSGTSQYNFHVAKYGSPSTFGFKDVINTWKAQNWNPDSLVHLYKNAGAQYFFAMANHHDNLDLYNSAYQPWNTVAIGPKKDLVGGWAQAAKKYGLPFGVSVHASRAWTWLEPSQNWDGNLTTADGVGKWWEGLNPQDLYAQRHARSTGSTDPNAIFPQWEWGSGASIPDTAYINKFYNRTIDLINKYHPDLIYFDDTSLPMTPISDVGLRITAHLYNKSMAENGGTNKAVIFGKKLTNEEKEAIVWDVERGIPDRPQQKYWQTCTCIGDWHYSTNVYNNNSYKSAQTIVRMLLDIVSKNGNMLLNIPVRGDGTIDDKELKIVQDLTAWMNVNKQGIYKTRPWITFGEGPTAEAVNPLSGTGFNEGTNYTWKDVRYVCKKDTVFASMMGWPEHSTITLKALGTATQQYLGKIVSVKLLGYGELTFTRNLNGLKLQFPSTPIATGQKACMVKIQFEPELYSFGNLADLIQQCALAIDSARTYQGYNTGQYNPDSLALLIKAKDHASLVLETDSYEQIRAATNSLQSQLYHFFSTARNQGGKLSFPKTQNITREVLGECRNFSRNDAGVLGTGRWGLLGEPWTVSNNLINQENKTRGGFDNYGSSKSISIQKWNTTDAAIQNGFIFQTLRLPSGSYKLKIKVHEQSGLQKGENYLCIAKGSQLPNTAEVPQKSLAYFDMSSAATGGQFTVCSFTTDTLTELSIGWTTTLSASAAGKSMRVNEVLLLDANDNDVSSTYLKNYSNIQRKDMSYKRYGTPTYWSVENFNIPVSTTDGTKKGIDTYTGYKSLMMGVWNDASKSTGNLKEVKMYQKVTLPAGRYAFMAGYDALDRLTDMNLFVSQTVPTVSNLKTTAISYYSITKNTNDGSKHGLEFALNQTTTVYIGWIGNLTEVPQQEFRAKEIVLYRILTFGNDFLADKTFDLSKPGNNHMDMSKFDQLNGMKWSSSVDNVNYVIGASAGRIEVGYVNFGDEKMQNISIETAINANPASSQNYQVFKDDETTPFTTILAKNTGGYQLYESLKSPDFLLGGIHKITIRFNNIASYVKSVGFSPSNATALKSTKKKKMDIISKNGEICVRDLNQGQLSIYDTQGKRIKTSTTASNSFQVSLPKGPYIVRMNDHVEKIMVN